MSRITRDGFIDSFGARGGLDLDTLGDDAKSALQQAGIGPDALQGLGGADHVISSHDELSRLFDLIDRVDHDGHVNSIATTTKDADGKTTATLGGEVYDALKNQMERARLGGQHTPVGKPNVADLPSPEAYQKSLAAITSSGFSDVHLHSVPYFNQANPLWAGQQYPKSPPELGESRTIQQAGCGPTSLAMMDCGLRNSHVTPDVTADFAVRKGVSGSPTSSGTDTAGLARAWADQHGLGLIAATSRDQAKNVDVLKAGVAVNGIALVSVGVDSKTGQGHFTEAGHVLVINGCAMKGGEEWFAIANPGRQDQSRTDPKHELLTVDANVIQVAGAQNGSGRLWITRTQLEAEMKRCFVFQSGSES